MQHLKLGNIVVIKLVFNNQDIHDINVTCQKCNALNIYIKKISGRMDKSDIYKEFGSDI